MASKFIHCAAVDLGATSGRVILGTWAKNKLTLREVHRFPNALRSAGGHEMPDGFPECTVYFPGTFQDPVTISGPTYFTSGVYYFQDVVTLARLLLHLSAPQDVAPDGSVFTSLPP